MSDYIIELFEQYARSDVLGIDVLRPRINSCAPQLVTESASAFQVVIPGYEVGQVQLRHVLHQLLHLRADVPFSYNAGLAVGDLMPDPVVERTLRAYEDALIEGSHPVLRVLQSSVDAVVERARQVARGKSGTFKPQLHPLAEERLRVRSS